MNILSPRGSRDARPRPHAANECATDRRRDGRFLADVLGRETYYEREEKRRAQDRHGIGHDLQNQIDVGYDIVFTASDGVTKLSHEIEKFDRAAGDLVAWVKVPYLSSGADTTIYMYYGNGTVGSQQDVANVWDANYEVVHHLQETSGQHLDSTSNNHDSTTVTVTTQGSAIGKINGADELSPVDEHVEVPDDVNLDISTNITVQAWVNLDVVTGEQSIVSHHDHGNNEGYYLYYKSSDFEFRVYDGATLYDAKSFNVSVSPATWYHVVGIYDGSSVQVYVDTTLGTTQPAFSGSIQASNDPLRFGLEAYSTNFDLDGRIDEVRISRTVRSTDWIQTEHNNQNSPSTFYNVCSATTAVELVSFTATGLDGEVLLEWETGSELNNLGFHLYRSPTDEGPYERITATAIPGLGSSPVGAKYAYRDSGLTNGVTHYYKLEDIETTGATKPHGPVSATPMASASSGGDDTDSGGSTSDEAASTSLITYGDPTANSFRVIKRNKTSAVLELVTEGFYAEPLEDGSVRLEVPGFESLAELTAPGVPVKRTRVEAVAGRKVKLLSVRAGGVAAFTSLRPSGAELPEIVATPEGTVRVAQRRRRAKRAFRGDGLNP